MPPTIYFQTHSALYPFMPRSVICPDAASITCTFDLSEDELGRYRSYNRYLPSSDQLKLPCNPSRLARSSWSHWAFDLYEVASSIVGT